MIGIERTPARSGNSNFVDYQTGWHIYNVDLTAQGGGANGNWLAEGNVAGFRVDAPWFKNGDNVHYDWARLTPANGNPVQITWNYSSGAPSQLVNLYLSASPDPNQDNEYQIAANVPASNRSYTWMGTGMAPGTYYIHANLNGAVSSSGPLNVNAAPVARIDAPSQFSGEDYAQAKLSAAWNGSNSTQFERTVNINPIQWTPSYLQTSATNNDPQVWWLDRDSTHAIDTSRYRYMSIRMWLQTPSSSPTSVFNAGPRMTWSQTANSDMQQTFLSFAPYNRWIPLSYDLPNAPLVLGTQGWTGYESTLRFDPHESDDQSGGRLPDFFRMDQSHLTSRSISGPSTLIRWSALQGNGSVDLFYDTDNSGYNGTQVASSVPLYNGSYAWNTSAVPNGVYYVYMIAHDSYNSSRVYSLVPLVVDHASPSTIFTDVPTNYWAVTYVNNMATRSIVSGYGQTDTSVMFRPGSSTTAGQLSKMITNSFGFAIDTSGGPHFSDVPTTQPFYPYIETLYNRGIVSGYADGTFRPGRGATRGQIAKMIALSGSQAYGWSLQNPATNTFADVPVGSTYFTYIETVYRHNQIISGYACGGPGEPCDGQQRPYFRPANSVTRAQLSKMLSNAIGAP